MSRSFSASAFQGDQFGAHALSDFSQVGLPEVLGQEIDLDPRNGHDPETGLFLSFFHFAAFPVEDLSSHVDPLLL
jgi:hypothetical protein